MEGESDPKATPPDSKEETRVLPFVYGHVPADVALLARHSFLANIGPQDFGAFLAQLDQVALPAGAVVFRQGDNGDTMYFVLDGRAHVDRGGVDVGHLGPGDHFGETAILAQPRARSATVQTDTPVRLARLSRARFFSFETTRPRAALHFMGALAGSLAATTSALRDNVGLLVRQRTLPRRSVVRVQLGSASMQVATGTRIGTLLPPYVEGALVVAATINSRALSLDTPLTEDARIAPLTTANWEGRRIFRTSALLLVLEAARRAVPSVALTVGPRIARRQLILASREPSEAEVAAIQAKLEELVEHTEPLREELWTIDEARTRFVDQGWHDAAALLSSYRNETVALLTCGETCALSLGTVLPAATVGNIQLQQANFGLFVDFGELLDAGTTASSMTTMIGRQIDVPPPARKMAHELASWLSAMQITSVGRFNESCVDGRVDELVRVSEGFHEKNIGRVADSIKEQRLRVVAIAGPSSSGKTTFIRRLKVQLEVNGLVPIHLSLDDYYVDREKTPVDEAGELDFESLGAIDLARFRSNIERLVAGERVRVARYDFATGRSLREGGDAITLAPTNVLLVEGLHALNPVLSDWLPRDAAFRVFVHPATALPFDRLSSVLPEDVRLLRRIVRDRHGRGYTARETIARWPSVRRGEERNVFPFATLADFVFDTSLVYEIAVLRVYAERYLLEVPRDDPGFVTAVRLRQMIDHFVPIYEEHVPRTSILREFIGGGFAVT
jgi:uridine kinase